MSLVIFIGQNSTKITINPLYYNSQTRYIQNSAILVSTTAVHKAATSITWKHTFGEWYTILENTILGTRIRSDGGRLPMNSFTFHFFTQCSTHKNDWCFMVRKIPQYAISHFTIIGEDWNPLTGTSQKLQAKTTAPLRNKTNKYSVQYPIR